MLKVAELAAGLHVSHVLLLFDRATLKVVVVRELAFGLALLEWLSDLGWSSDFGRLSDWRDGSPGDWNGTLLFDWLRRAIPSFLLSFGVQH